MKTGTSTGLLCLPLHDKCHCHSNSALKMLLSVFLVCDHRAFKQSWSGNLGSTKKNKKSGNKLRPGVGVKWTPLSDASVKKEKVDVVLRAKGFTITHSSDNIHVAHSWAVMWWWRCERTFFYFLKHLRCCQIQPVHIDNRENKCKVSGFLSKRSYIYQRK